MTEQEYIDATNLAKVRTALTIMRDYLDMDVPHDKHASAARMALVRLSNALERIVAIDPEQPTAA